MNAGTACPYIRLGTALIPGRRRSCPPICTANALGAENPCAGSWHVAHAIRPDADSAGSKNKARPSAVIAAARAYAAAAEGVAPHGDAGASAATAGATNSSPASKTHARITHLTQTPPIRDDPGNLTYQNLASAQDRASTYGGGISKWDWYRDPEQFAILHWAMLS